MSGIFQRLEMQNYEDRTEVAEDRGPFMDAVAENDRGISEGTVDSAAIDSAGDVADEVLATRNIALRQSESETGLSPDAAEAISVQTESWNKRLGDKIFGTIRHESFRSKPSAKTQTMVMESGFMNKLKSIWDAIVAMLKKAVNWFKEMFGKLVGSSATGGAGSASEDLKKSIELWSEIDLGTTHDIKDGIVGLDFSRVSKAVTAATSRGKTEPTSVADVTANSRTIADFYSTGLHTLMSSVLTTYKAIASDAKSLKSAVEKLGGRSADKQKDGDFMKAWDPVATKMSAAVKSYNSSISSLNDKSLGNSAYIEIVTAGSTPDSGAREEISLVRVRSIETAGGKDGPKLEVKDKAGVTSILDAAQLFQTSALNISKTKADGDKAAQAISDCSEAADNIAKAFEKAGNAKLTEDESKAVQNFGHLVRSVEPAMKSAFLSTTQHLIRICSEFSTDLRENAGKVTAKKED